MQRLLGVELPDDSNDLKQIALISGLFVRVKPVETTVAAATTDTVAAALVAMHGDEPVVADSEQRCDDPVAADNEPRVGMPELQVHKQAFVLALRDFYANYDKADNTTQHSLTAVQEALWWVHFTAQVNENWACHWNNTKMDHAGLDEQRLTGSNPRVFGCTAFNKLMREQTHECNFVVGTAKEIYALNPAEFQVFTPDTQDSEIMHPDVFETHLRSHVNLMSGTIGVKTIEGAFRNLVNAISPVLPNYIASGDHQEKNASFFVHELKEGRTRAMVIWVLYCLEHQGNGCAVKDNPLTRTLDSKKTLDGLGAGGMGDGPQEQPTKKQKSARTREAQAADLDLEISNALKNLTNTMSVVHHEFRQQGRWLRKHKRRLKRWPTFYDLSWLHHEGIEPLQEEEEEFQEEEEE